MTKTLFIDSTPDIDRVWRQVHGPKDIPIAVNMGPVAAGDVPKTIAGYDTVINDATYFNEATA
jgi:D-3-phosphoglycerate dehydrogenase / 2-oxoglutarate reductase